MRKRAFIAMMIGGLMMAGAGMASRAEAASQAVDQTIARTLDGKAVEFTRHTREHRMMEIQRNLDRQQRGRRYGPPRGYGRGGYDRGRSYGHRRDYGRGPGNRGYGRGFGPGGPRGSTF